MLADSNPEERHKVSPNTTGSSNKVDYESAEFRNAQTVATVVDVALGVGAAVKTVKAVRSARAAKATAAAGSSGRAVSNIAPRGAGVLVDGAGSGTRTINFRPNAADPNWGLTQSHVNKHMFGSGKHSLRQIDPGGNPDLWRNYIQDLAGRSSTATLKGGVEDVIGTFPRAGGGGTFQFGIRVAPGPNGSWDLVTLLTRQ